MDYLIGVDFGQSQDYTALVVLERHGKHPEQRFNAVHLERLALGTSYPKQVERVGELYGVTKAKADTHLIVDQTGVGRPVVDMLKQAKLKPVPITITGGLEVTRDRDEFRVPKRDLVSTVQVLLQTERIKIARELKEAQTLVDELLAFKVKIGLSGHDSYGNDVGEWRENPHDDLVLATALAVWWGERPTIVRPPVFGSWSARGVTW